MFFTLPTCLPAALQQFIGPNTAYSILAQVFVPYLQQLSAVPQSVKTALNDLGSIQNTSYTGSIQCNGYVSTCLLH